MKRSDDVAGFLVLPKRWIVERTFSWLYRYRRLGKDYELLPENSEAMILIAMINLMSRRLACGHTEQDFKNTFLDICGIALRSGKMPLRKLTL